MLITKLIYATLLNPPVYGSESGQCVFCGQGDAGQLFVKWVKPTFTNGDMVGPGDIVCNACLFCCDEASMLLADKVGKENPQRMRNYSHFVVGDEWLTASKGDKRNMTTWLMGDDLQAAVIAESGQKHLLFRCSLGMWQFEEAKLAPQRPLLAEMLSLVNEAYNAGMNKAEIESGRMGHRAIDSIGLLNVLNYERHFKGWRGTVVFRLALFLAQKEEEDARIIDGVPDTGLPIGVSTSGEVAHADLERDTERLQTEIRPQHLGADGEQHKIGGVHKPDTGVYQLSLFAPASGGKKG